MNNNLLQEFYVGQRMENMIGEGLPAYTVSNTGIMIVQPLSCPTEKEIQHIKENRKCFYLTHINGVVSLIIDFGGGLQFEYDINPYIMPEIEIPDFPEGMGLGVCFVLVNSMNGIVEAIQMMGLNKAFSTALLKALKEEQQTNRTTAEYAYRAYDLQRKYTLKQLIKMNKQRFTIEHNERKGA